LHAFIGENANFSRVEIREISTMAPCLAPTRAIMIDSTARRWDDHPAACALCLVARQCVQACRKQKKWLHAEACNH